jgi:protein gp37
MAENSPIEWTDHTWSPWEGCTKVSPGCDNCYAAGMNNWLRKGSNWGPGAPRREYSDDHWEKPLRWNAAAKKAGVRLKVFPSVCDPFDNAIEPERRARFFDLIGRTHNLDWLLLTKRIGNAGQMLPWTPEGGVNSHMASSKVWPNVWLGATIVNQDEADRDIPKLLATPARVRFLSMEPLLGPVNLWLPTRTFETGRGPYGTEKPILLCDHCCNGDRCDDRSHCERGRPEWRVHCPYCRGTGRGRPIDWVIVGGESGRKARPMQTEWAQALRDQCAAAGVPYLFKQWGEWLGAKQDGAYDHEPLELNGSDVPVRVGRKAAGRSLDGVTHDGFPEVTT